ncbi:OsmC family protein [Acidovorax sp.]|uniref:OsmC family protein n=1 Tax=Acidovorax sp. TaxID=1872122 RepID=UPI002ACEADBA|nr:OsmC family protein [Acidovorax sp.]MDZ7864261.1 OsmC family protein [Acidovorax sp.]
MSDAMQTVRLTQVLDYQFELDFGDTIPRLLADEPVPLGTGKGPSPVQLLASSVGNCLSASLLFALRKFKQQPGLVSCNVRAEVGRNADGRLRVLSMAATLQLGMPARALEHLDRVLASFESYCTVTQSVGAAIPIEVAVLDGDGVRLK